MFGLFSFFNKKKQKLSPSKSITYLNKRVYGQDKAELCNIQALARLKKGDLKGALKQFDKALNFCDEIADIYFQRASVLVQIQDFDAALSDICRSIELEPLETTYYLFRSKVYQNLGKSDLSMEDKTKADTLKEKKEIDLVRPLNSCKEYVDRANQKMENQDFLGALKDLEEAYKKDKHCEEIHLIRGAIHQSMGDGEKATQEFLKAKELAKEKEIL